MSALSSMPPSRRGSFVGTPLSQPPSNAPSAAPSRRGSFALSTTDETPEHSRPQSLAQSRRDSFAASPLFRRSSTAGQIPPEGLRRRLEGLSKVPPHLGDIGPRPSSHPDREAVQQRETEFVGAIDCGTTSCRFYIFDQWADIIANYQIEFEQLHPEPGWHEHDPSIYTREIDRCIEEGLKQFKDKGHELRELKCVGIATQRETTLLWDKETGEPLYNAIAWPDARNAANVRDLRARAEERTFHTPDGEIVGEEGIRRLTGLPLSTYFSATKWDWMKDNVEEVADAIEKKTLLMGTVDTWLVYQYTGGEKHITDASNACRTLLYNLHKQDWCDELCEFFQVPMEALPRVVSNSEVYGVFKKGHPLEGVPIAGLIGDQQAALVGNKCLKKGDAKQTYGTGCFMLYNTGTEVVRSTHGLVSTVGYKMGPNEPLHYALEGSVAVGGSSVTWLRDNLGMIEHPREAGKLAEQVEDTGGVYFVTGFSGLFAPYWDMRATGMMIGLSTYTTKHHIARATLEATCFQTRAILEAMSKDVALSAAAGGGKPKPDGNGERVDGVKGEDDQGEDPAEIRVLQVDGGMTGSDVTMQLQADILGIDVRRPLMRESTVLGAALLAGAALKLFGWDLSTADSLAKVNRLDVSVFKSQITDEEREWKYAGWVRAIDRARGWQTNSGHG
ncbi:glycerol kinase [Rhodotorula paludigena]|uniref:glycerol kinase n=1 Tax=Rhodotorula paludigena TaxID=86838 RepID=UPI00316E3DCB